MDFDLDSKSVRLSVGELADFAIGPRDGGSGTAGIWRAQLGSHWHREMQAQTTSENPAAHFEVTVDGEVFHRGWRVQLNGRIDQLVPEGDITVLREIKTLTRAVPVPEDNLREDYPHYFAQLATYLALRRQQTPEATLRGELVFVETGSGLSQTILVSRAEEELFTARLERLTQFLDLHVRARQRRLTLQFSPPFPALRPGQEDTRANLESALARNSVVAFEAPTGFGKTGVMLEVALHALKAARCDRIVYLTSKSTGQLQVVETLRRMTAPGEVKTEDDNATALAIWHVRNKREHCVNDQFHCVREHCRFLCDMEERWPDSGLDRFHLFENQPRDIAILRAAGREATICPYEITRTALAFQDVWVGDYNYVFAPANRGVFDNQPGWNPARTLLIIDEAHNLPPRVADAHSHVLRSSDCRAVLADLDHVGAPRALRRDWETLMLQLSRQKTVDVIDPEIEADLLELLQSIVEHLTMAPIDYGKLSPQLADTLWSTVDLVAWLQDTTLTRLLWSPRECEIHFTCLDAAPLIAERLREFGHVLLASATLGPAEAFAAANGLPTEDVARIEALTPWRDDSYDVAIDLRVDTRYKYRTSHYDLTTATIRQLQEAANAAVVVFFPSYAYAAAIEDRLDTLGSPLRVAVQPRLPDLAAQVAWVEESIALADVIFLVLGSSFAEGIDALGGRVSHAMVVGPALPEVNARQRRRMEELERGGATREDAFDRVYRIPGLQKVNQGLGRLVRAPGQRTKVLLHCLRFEQLAFARLLARDYQMGVHIPTDDALSQWLGSPAEPV